MDIKRGQTTCHFLLLLVTPLTPVHSFPPASAGHSSHFRHCYFLWSVTSVTPSHFRHSYFCWSLPSFPSLLLELQEGKRGWRSSCPFLVLHIANTYLGSDMNLSTLVPPPIVLVGVTEVTGRNRDRDCQIANLGTFCQNHLFQKFIIWSISWPARLLIKNMEQFFSHIFSWHFFMASASKHNTVMISVTENGSGRTFGSSDTP